MNDKNENIDFFDIETLTTEEKNETLAKNNNETETSEPSNWQEILKNMQGETQKTEQQQSSPEVDVEPKVVEDKAVTSALEEAFSAGSDNYEIKPMKSQSGKGALILLLILVLLVGGVFALQYTEIIDLPFLEFIDNLKK